MTRAATMRCGERVLLNNGEAFSLPPSSPCREIVCTEGVIWVTFHGDPQDYILLKGGRLSTRKKKNAVISGFGRSEFSLIQDDGIQDDGIQDDGARANTPLQGLKRSYAT